MELAIKGLSVRELENIELFKYVNMESIIGLLESCAVKEMNKEEILIRPEEKNKTIYLILSGRVRIHLNSLEADPLVIIGAGESIGEMSVIDQELTSAYAVADEPCRLLVMEEDILWSLVESSHAAACNLLFILTKRLRRTDFVISENVHVERVYQRYGSVDALTGLHNRHWLNNALERHCHRCTASDEALSLLMIDIDRFKEINDTNGHLYGDKILYWIAHTISNHLRPAEVIARFGGDEFVVLLPNIRLQQAMDIGERLQVAVKEAPLPEMDVVVPCPTLSIGAAQLENREQTSEELLAKADAALYRAKSKGRNCVSD